MSVIVGKNSPPATPSLKAAQILAALSGQLDLSRVPDSYLAARYAVSSVNASGVPTLTGAQANAGVGVTTDTGALSNGVNAATAAANAAATAAANAQTQAEAAQANANAALGTLADIADQNTLTPGEKPPVISDVAVLTAEQAGIDAQATLYGLTSLKATYDDALATLVTYLGTLTTPVPWNNVTGNTTLI